MTAEEQGFLAALTENPDDRTTRAAYADWLDEHGRRYEAILERGWAGVSEVFYKLRRKSDGLFSECNTRRPDGWSTEGKMWRDLAGLKAHMVNYERARRGRWVYKVPYLGQTEWTDLEVVVVELRLVEGVTLPVKYKAVTEGKTMTVTITVPEPTGGAKA